ncbi:N-6 DNA methylase [Acinetobacter bereziniae]|uniref:class I SAM-dependent DNA methyltransferase n=1 Tax=Acinetobacter bereziniae TaxID=106648 RepID=UPI003AF460C0
MNATTLISKIWNFCHTLRDDGVGYGDYLEQLTFLLFLKMAHEQKTLHPFESVDIGIPNGFDWDSLINLKGAELEDHYLKVLSKLGTMSGMLGAIFFKAQNKIQDPAKLHRLVSLINEDTWSGIGADVKGDMYEGLLQKNAEDTKSGAGQYFTPRPVIDAIVECVRPKPMKTIADPACGTGGFFLGAHKYLLSQKLDNKQAEFLKEKTFFGNEIVASTRRLCLMNLYLHNVGHLTDEPHIARADALISEPSVKVDYVLANPPFGKKSSMTLTNEEGEEDKESLTYERPDFWVTTSNKQLNFLQHIVSMLKADGKAAVVLPDNVLFEGGVGERVRKKLLAGCDVHTILRLPTGIFYANGVKANVIFFDNKPKSEKTQTKGIWFYDLRTNQRFTLKTRQLRQSDLSDFIQCYNPENRFERQKTERFKYFSYDEIIARDKTSLDIFWLKDNSLDNLDDLPSPDVLQQEIIEHLEAALEAFKSVAISLKN